MAIESHREPPNIGAYDLFVLANTILAMIALTVLALPFFNAQAKQIALVLDSFLSFLFFFDFLYLLLKTPRRRAYFVKWGWVDLLGCIPSFPWLRVLRVFRAVRVALTMRRYNPQELREHLAKHPDRNTFFFIATLSIVMVSAASYAIFRIEQASPERNINSATDAIWWSIVTITTVGYGDRFPTTNPGRLVAIVLMFIGIGIFGALTSYLSTMFINTRRTQSDIQEKKILMARFDAIEHQIEALTAELRELNRKLPKKD